MCLCVCVCVFVCLSECVCLYGGVGCLCVCGRVPSDAEGHMTSLGAMMTGFFVFPHDWSISRSPRIPQLWISATNVIVGIRQRTRDAGTRATARLLATVFTLLHNQEQDCAPGPRSGSTPDTDLGPPLTRTWTWVHPGPRPEEKNRLYLNEPPRTPDSTRT